MDNRSFDVCVDAFKGECILARIGPIRRHVVMKVTMNRADESKDATVLFDEVDVAVEKSDRGDSMTGKLDTVIEIDSKFSPCRMWIDDQFVVLQGVGIHFQKVYEGG